MNEMTRQMDIEGFAEPLDLFSYAALSRETEAAAREDAALIRSHALDIVAKGIEIGRALNRQKAVMEHGLFTSWVRDECKLSHGAANTLMRSATRLEANSRLNESFGRSQISIAAMDVLFAGGTPQEVRDKVEELLVDGQKVTVADIRKMKAEAKSKDESVEALAARNSELVKLVAEPVKVGVDEDAIREEGRAAAEQSYIDRVNGLSNANVAANAEIQRLAEEVEKLKLAAKPAVVADEKNVVRTTFGSLEEDPDDYTDELKAVSAFAGAIGSMEGLEFSAEAFWKKEGKRSTHGKRLHQALLSANATIGILIKEYSK